MNKREAAADLRLEWDLADRMRKSLRASGTSVKDMANEFGVERQTVGNWLGGRSKPNVATLRIWALRTGAPLEWLRGEEGLPRMDSNHQPAGYRTDEVIDMASKRRRIASYGSGKTAA